MSESGTQALPFGGIADRYDRFRPGVPTAPDWLLPDSCGTEFVGHVGAGACAIAPAPGARDAGDEQVARYAREELGPCGDRRIESPTDFRRLRTTETPATAP